MLPPPISADPTRYHLSLSLSLSESNEKAVNKKKHIEMASDGGAGPSQVIRVRPNMEDGHGDKIVKSTRSFQSTKCKIMKYRVSFLTGPAQKSSKYGTGPAQQQKLTKYTGPTQG